MNAEETGPLASEGGSPCAVAVVIPVHNPGAVLEATLESVLAQTHAPDEIVLVDDGCTDGSIQRAARREGVRVVSGQDSGIDSSRRFGIANTSAPLVALLDHDDVWHPEHLSLLVAVLGQRPDAAAAVVHARPFEDGEQVEYDPPRIDPVDADPWLMYPSALLSTPSGAVIRRTALEAVGGWTGSDLGAAGDLYGWLRLVEWGPIIINRCATVGHRMHPKSESALTRKKSPLGYAHQIALAGELAARERAERVPSEAARMTQLSRIAGSVRHLARGVFEDNTREIAIGARLLEQGMRGQPEVHVLRTFAVLFWLIEGWMVEKGSEVDLYRPLIKGWPLSVRRTARYRLGEVAARAVLRRALQRPFEAWRWRWLIEWALYRVAGTHITSRKRSQSIDQGGGGAESRFTPG